MISTTKRMGRALVFGAAGTWMACSPDTTRIRDTPPDVIAPLQTGIVRLVAHGAFFDSDGREIRVNEDGILASQRYYIDLLEGQGNVETRSVIYELVEDEILANALYVDELVEASQTDDRAWIVAVNSALRLYYAVDLLGQAAPEVRDTWTKGVEAGVARELEEAGVTVLLSINSSGDEYQDACRAAGVPVPRAVYSNEWTNRGDFDGDEFISPSLVPELWSWVSEEPAGVCLALPRHPPGENLVELFGVICLGTNAGKACFFDNPRGVKFPRFVERSLDEFVGGADLVANNQGVCSDCHAGENPYVVHPYVPPFEDVLSDLGLRPLRWYEPLVDNSWPQNPGPSTLLDAVTSPERCSSCHRSSGNRAFPILSAQYAGYCNIVLTTAIGRTMPPPNGANTSRYAAQIDALRSACRRPSPDGKVVPVGPYDEQAYLSPPRIFEPLYACATQVAVLGAPLNADLTVGINGVNVGMRVVRSPTREVFDVPDLGGGDQVVASITLEGQTATSTTVLVKSHLEDYPAGLPVPSVDPDLIYECAESIAVRHVPGAILTIYSNGTDPSMRPTSTDYSVGYPRKRPFDVGDEFTAQVSLCSDVSGISDPETARPAPGFLPSPTFEPPEVFVGQELVALTTLTNGATTIVSEASAGDLGDTGPWPVSWYLDFDLVPGLGSPVQPGHQLQVRQALCEESASTPPPPALDCESLRQPRIAVPFARDQIVTVLSSAPGARVFVFDQSNAEIGDGSGTAIALSRPLVAGETITAIQKLGQCVSQAGYEVVVLDRPQDG